MANKQKHFQKIRSNNLKATVSMMKEEGEDGQITFKLITFHEEEIGSLYEEDSSFYKTKKQNKLPIIKRIENGN